QEDSENKSKNFAEKHQIKNISFAVMHNAAGPPGFKTKLAKEAELTVILYNRRTTVANHALQKGGLTEQATSDIMKDVAKLLGSAAEPVKENVAAKKLMQDLQGKWLLESLVVRGTKMGEDQIKDRSVVILGDKMHFKVGAKDMGSVALHLDPGGKVAALNQTFVAGPLQGSTLKSLFKVEGDRL